MRIKIYWFGSRSTLGFGLLLLLGLLISTAQASTAIDDNVEAELDQFLHLMGHDTKAANTLLLKIAPKVNELTPAATRVRFNVYMASQHAVEGNYQQADELLLQSWKLAEQQQDPDIWAEVLAEHLKHAWIRGQMATALSYIEPLLQYAPKATKTRIKYYGWNTVASFQAWRGNFEKALAAYYQAYASIENDVDKRTPFRKMSLRVHIASLNLSLRNYTVALKTIQDGLVESKANPELGYHIPDFYIEEGDILIQMGKLNEALQSYQQGLVWSRQQKNLLPESTLHNKIGDIYLRQRKLDLASDAFENSITFSISQKKKLNLAESKFKLGYVKVLKGKYAEGIEQMKATIKELTTLGGKTERLSYLVDLADAHSFAGQHQDEANVLRQHNQLSSEIFQTEREKQLNMLQEEFSANEKNKEIAALSQQNKLNAITIERQNLKQQLTFLIGLIVILAFGLLFIFTRKIRQANLELNEANKKLAYQSLRDPLTGLFNRRSLMEHMERQQQGERRAAASQLTDGFILLDIDFFKLINDNDGHAAGDSVLVEIAKRLTELSRTEDMVWRWGGEEFLIMLSQIDMAALTQFTQRILDEIGNNPITFGQQQLHVTASAGFLTYPFAGLDEQTLNWSKALQLADMALYLGKTQGRNRAYGLVSLSQPFQDIAAKLETDLSLAIEQGLVDVVVVKGPTKKL